MDFPLFSRLALSVPEATLAIGVSERQLHEPCKKRKTTR